MGGADVEPTCELCEAAPITERYYEDDLCWVAECESCSVPMVVWKRHDPDPPEEIRVVLLKRLAEVMELHFESEWWLDDNLRSIPHHYHAHARTRGGFFGRSLRRIATL
jgi:hypothetical protein